MDATSSNSSSSSAVNSAAAASRSSKPSASSRKRTRASDEEVIVVEDDEEQVVVTSTSDGGAVASSSSVAVRATRSTRATTAAASSSSVTTTTTTTLVTASKVRKTATVTQPTMERFSQRVAASSEAAAAREAKQNPFQLQWREHGTLLFLDSRPDAPAELRIKPSAKIAAFDMDNTLLRTASGRKFPVGRNDWHWYLPLIPARLKQLQAEGFKIVIFSNQNGISTGNASAAEIKGKILDIIRDCGVSMQAFLASADDLYRKPAADMWTFFTRGCNGGVSVDLAQSIYVGDAAGRPAAWDGNRATKKDFSCSDRKFAFNVGLPFATPEEFFLRTPPAPFSWGAVDPTAVRAMGQAPLTSPTPVADPATPHPSAAAKAAAARNNNAASSPSPSPSPQPLPPAAASSSSSVSAAVAPASVAAAAVGPFHSTAGPELVVFCGFPASGKSTFARKHFVPHGYVHVNQDTLKNKERCVKAAAEALQAGKSVVVDNTNPSAELRALYVQHAKKAGVPARCFHFTATEDLAKHCNMFREKLTNGAHKHVPRIAYNMYKSKFQSVELREGFTEIKKIEFVPQFDSTPEGERARNLFYQMS